MVRKVAEKVFIPFTVGGGIRTVDDFKALLREGADKISINSSAINRPELISEAADKFGSQCVVERSMQESVQTVQAGIFTRTVDVLMSELMLWNGQ